MSIEELYDEYCKLKSSDMSFEDLEFAFYSKLICLKDSKEDSFSEWSIRDSIIPRPDRRNCTMDEFMRMRNERYKWNFSSRNGFIKCDYLDAAPAEKNYIKFYLSVPDEQKEKFLVDYGNYVKENAVRGSFKIRSDSQANDLVTVRVYNPKHYKEVFEFLSGYVNKEISQHFLMPTINGIGVTIDDDQSYNKFVTDSLMSYFDSIVSREEVTNSNFFKYIVSPDFIEQLDIENKVSLNIYTLNLLNAFDDNLSIDSIVDFVAKSQENIANYPVPERNIVTVNNKILASYRMCERGELDDALNNNMSLFSGGYSVGVEEALSNHLLKLDDYDTGIGPMEYMRQQFVKFDSNMQKTCLLLDSIYSERGIEGVKEFIDDVDNINSNNSDKFDLELEDVYIPFCHNDELHPVYPIKNKISLKAIYGRVAKNSDVKVEEYIYGEELKEKIVGLYEIKNQKS